MNRVSADTLETVVFFGIKGFTGTLVERTATQSHPGRCRSKLAVLTAPVHPETLSMGERLTEHPLLVGGETRGTIGLWLSTVWHHLILMVVVIIAGGCEIHENRVWFWLLQQVVWMLVDPDILGFLVAPLTVETRDWISIVDEPFVLTFDGGLLSAFTAFGCGAFQAEVPISP